ncbi:hypothetical protein GQ43DRAFT_459463 [Delitschia confertaspora ATCC 74209]|uniref:DUF7357 domain-containing protein n=1 Tax=Delitschia confertaspora ATCC 74209 TaxID=1513339 RepID=A0A9P4JVT1_9PLEO|nr:hypothetical protein GQ43DRAFT_459463 [Delitschia confertaspora ATCC 74209]
MRLRLTVYRHKLPPILVLWSIPAYRMKQSNYTIAQLLEDVNDMVPLESDTWAMDDYVVEIEGFECLHYAAVAQTLSNDDNVCIRPLQTAEIRSRTLSGRYQISAAGQHLIDGVPFGRPYLRQPNRPAIRIPPRKRSRLTISEEEEEGEDSAMDDSVVDSSAFTVPAGPVPRWWKQLALRETEDGREGEEETGKQRGVQHSARGHGAANYGQGKMVQFEEGSESDEEFIPEEQQDDSVEESTEEDEEDEEEEEEEEEEDDDDEISDVSSEYVDNASASRSSSSSASESSSSDESETTSKPEVLCSKPVSLRTAAGVPGEGTSVTKQRNRRRKETQKLNRLKGLGILRHDATLADLREWTKSSEISRLELLEKAKQQHHRGTQPQAQAVHHSEKLSKPKVTHVPAQQNQSRTIAEEKQVFEQRRLELLKAIEGGGIDVTPTNEKKRKAKGTAPSFNADSPGLDAAASVTKIEPAANDNTASTDRSAKRLRLDVAGSRRMLFSSLGLRAPKTKEDAERLQVKLAEGGRKPVKRPSKEDDHIPELQDPDGWKSRINLSAFECWDEEVELSAPPFPFTQHWDPASKRMEEERKKSRKKKKGMHPDSHPMENTDESVQLNYENGVEDTGNKRDVDRDIQLQLQRDMHDAENKHDLPLAPADPSTLPPLLTTDVKVGTVIVFKRWVCTAETHWCPELSGVQTAEIEEITEAETLKLRLAERDRPVKQRKYAANGNRVYEKFDQIELNDSDDESDDVIYESYDQLVEPRLLQAAAAETEKEPGNLEAMPAETPDQLESSAYHLNKIPSTSPPSYNDVNEFPLANDANGTDQEMMLVQA